MEVDESVRDDVDGDAARRSPRWRILAIAAACAVAAAVAVAAAALAGRTSPTRAAPRLLGPSSSLIGVHWVLVDIGGSHGHLDLHAKRLDVGGRGSTAWLELDRSNSALLNDGVNVSDDTYKLTGSKLLLHPGPTTLVGLAPGHTDREMIVTAMQALAVHDPTQVGVSLSAARLVLRAAGYVFTFHNGGAFHTAPTTAVPSSPVTATAP